MTTALSPLSTVATLAHTALHYITSVPLPEPAHVTLMPHENRIKILPRVHNYNDPVAVIGSLLLWSHRLTGITGEQWYTPSAHLHITLRGRLHNGIRIEIYDGIPYNTVRAHVRLKPRDIESITPDELYRLALDLRTERTAS